MTPKKVPTRRCLGCGEHFPKGELSRVVRVPSGEIRLDRTGKLAGRGAYLCQRAECLRRARKARRLEQALASPISEELYLLLEGELDRA